jgi:RNA polymerase sigma factor (sigma-70 family)
LLDDAKSPDFSRFLTDLIDRKAHWLTRCGYHHQEHDDLCQELHARFLKRLPKFKSARATLEGFATVVVGNAARDLRRRRQTQIRRPVCLSLTLDDDDRPAELGAQVTHQDLDRRYRKSGRTELEHVQLRFDVRSFLEGLPPDDRRVAEGVMAHGLADYVRVSGEKRSTVMDRLRRLRPHLTKGHLDEYLRDRPSSGAATA